MPKEKDTMTMSTSIKGARRTALLLGAALAALGLVAPEGSAHAQAAALVGSLGNFDALNNTGQPTHGFEIDCDGVAATDIYRIFGNWGGTNVIRYGAGTATDYTGGVAIRWASPYDVNAGSYTQTTPVPTTLTSVPGESCWTLGVGVNYPSAGCEHFGISAYKNCTATRFHWLVDDPSNPGTLVFSPAPVALPLPVWTVYPPAVVGNPPVVVAEIAAPPPPPEQPAQFGDAQWVKIYKTENNNEVQLEDLVGENAAVVPEQAAQVEVGWTLLQADPANGLRQKGRNKVANQGNLGGGSHAVVRRYEHYKYAGAYDPLTHEALCADGTCTAPSAGELGDAIGAQNAAANVNVPQLTIGRSGNGQVTSADKALSCGSKCTAFYALGTSVTLTAAAASGSVFTGWSGACSGAQLSCTVNINDSITVSASFALVNTLSIGRSGNGTVTGVPSGNDRAISCGSNCSAKFTQGTVVTLTATPAPGLSFVNWTNGCSGTSPTTSVTIAKDTTCQANFK